MRSKFLEYFGNHPKDITWDIKLFSQNYFRDINETQRNCYLIKQFLENLFLSFHKQYVCMCVRIQPNKFITYQSFCLYFLGKLLTCLIFLVMLSNVLHTFLASFPIIPSNGGEIFSCKQILVFLVFYFYFFSKLFTPCWRKKEIPKRCWYSKTQLNAYSLG